MEEEDNIIVKWAQEDVETSYKLLNNNNFKYVVIYANFKLFILWMCPFDRG